ncbi:hypothetical protein [Acetobacter cerevisiae]|uniref:hypothetical protein n=1 Tax=Acetobacter cerevisiae TaxID=178900 RepID=UPI000A817237|nr:hypothetical protein [Acetobacter cerevisiae]
MSIHAENHAAPADACQLNGVREPVLGFRVQDDRAYAHVDPDFRLSVINDDADCRNPVSDRQLLVLLEVSRLLESPQLPQGFDGLSYLRGFLAGMKSGSEPLLLDYRTSAPVALQPRSRPCSHCHDPRGLSGDLA